MRLFTCLFSLSLILAFTGQSFAQTQDATAVSGTSASPVPRLIKFSGILLDHQGQPLKGPVGVTFSLYAQQAGDGSLWMETQNVELDAKGVYAVLLGANTAAGLPEEMFRSGEARWLGIQPEREPELPRVLLVSAPYALKAADAETLGGLPASAFVLAGSPAIVTNGSGSSLTSETTAIVTSGSSSSAVASAVGTIPVTTAGGTVNMLAKFDAAADITKSLIFDNGSNVGIGNTAPAAKLDVSGSGIFRGFLQLPATSTANSTTKGFNSQPFDILASVFNGTAAVNQHFRWQAEPVNPGLTTASGKLNLLFASGTGAPAETGLSIANNGRITFTSGQTFPGTGTITGITTASGSGLQGGVSSGAANLSLIKTCASGQTLTWNGTAWACSGTGTVTGVIAGTDLTGGGTVGNVTLNLDGTKVPRLAAANTFVGNQTVTGNVTATGEVQGGVVNATTSFDIGGTLFALGSVKSHSAFLGFAGNAASTGNFNTASGYQALLSNSTGFNNSAIGAFALASNITGTYNTASGINVLYSNTTGIANTASGGSALRYNITGSNNTASGGNALRYNTTGSNNTALGYGAGSDSTQPSLSNATAIGAYADVAESNALVLGSISGVNGATASTNVGIGTPTPQYTLDVHGTGNFTGPVNFAAGQTFPGVPQLSAANTFTASQSVNGNITATGIVTGGVVDATSVNAVGAVNSAVVNATTGFDIGGTPFAFGSYGNQNAFLGFAGNSTMTGIENIAVGINALYSNTTGNANTAVGINALHSNTAGTGNTATGIDALYYNNGVSNTATGYDALYANTTGYGNTASGHGALYLNTTGGHNTAIGNASLFSNKTGVANTASGDDALYSNTTGNNNTAIGQNALWTNTAGTSLTCMGYSCGTSVDGLTNATGIGANALVGESNALVLGSITGVNGATSSTNVGIGTTTPLYTLDVHGTGNFTGTVNFAAAQTFPGVPQLSAANTFTASQSVNGSITATGTVTSGVVVATSINATGAVNSGVVNATTGFDVGGTPFAFGSYANKNAFLGFAGNSTMTGNSNTASGFQALYSNTAGFNNTASGFNALYSNTAGDSNTASGFNALYSDTTGSSNTATGDGALYSNTAGIQNTASGYLALSSNTTGNYNSASGVQALFANITGYYNTASGYQALYNNTTGSNNTASGASALASDTTGYANTATGDGALQFNTTGIANTASGVNALVYNNTGHYNTANGFSALSWNTTGSYNTALGYFAGPDSSHPGLTNATAIGTYADVAESNALVLGSISGINGGTASVNVGIGTTTPQYTLDVHGTGNFTGTVNFAAAQTFPNTISAVNAGTGLTGNVSGTSVTLNVDTTKVPILSAANTFTASQSVNGNITSTGTVTGGSANFSGNVSIGGSLSKGSGSFKIDHPLDPANKYLYHSFVESPDMMNVYNGNVVTDKNGKATVVLPEYFEALNSDFRYQLTVIGRFAQAIVASEISHNQFTIRTDKPRVKVSWQVTGIRQDAYAKAHRIQVEEDKPQQEQGRYLHPELFGAPPEQGVGYHAPPTPTHAETARATTSKSPSSPLK